MHFKEFGYGIITDMEPKKTTPLNPEFSAPVVTPEAWSGIGYEQAPESSRERQPVAPERSGENELPMPSMPFPVTPQTTSPSVSTAQPTTDDNPLTAGDDDVIEKEWVDKAKKIISTTKGDPYRREYEVGKLQADYIEKRYGKKLGEDS